MLTREQRLPVVVALREEGHSYRAIGQALGVSQKTVFNDSRSAGVTQVTPDDRVAGLDGPRGRQARRRCEVPCTCPSDTQVRRDLGSPATPVAPERVTGQDGKSYPASRAKTDRQKQRENAHLGRIKTGIASILGSCKGVEEINLKLAAEAASPGELIGLTVGHDLIIADGDPSPNVSVERHTKAQRPFPDVITGVHGYSSSSSGTGCSSPWK